MHGISRPALAAAALLALIAAATAAFAENDSGQSRAAGGQRGDAACANPPPTVTPEITVLNKHEVEGILGRDVRSAADEDMGRIVDVLVDRAGQVRAAIIDFGGFLGVGSRKIAVDWNALHFPEPGKPGERIALELTRDQVKAAPEYKEGKPVVVLGALGKLEPLPDNNSQIKYWRSNNNAGDVFCPRNHLRRFGDSPDQHGAGGSAPPPDQRLDAAEPPLAPSARSLRGLDWFIFFVADVQTGFGPFVSVFLTTQKWTQVDIGLVLSAAGFVSLIAQMPGGALVDAARSERLVAGIAVGGDLLQRPGLRRAADLPDGAVGGRRARAGKLRARPGDCRDQSRSGRSCGDRRTAGPQRPLCLHRQRPRGRGHGRGRILFFTARGLHRHRLLARAGAAGAARHRCRGDRSGARPRRGAAARPTSAPTKPGDLMRNRPLLIFACCLLLFHLANAAMLPLMGSVVTMRSARWATVLIARLHRRPSACRRRALAVDRPARADLGPPAVAADRLCRSAHPRHSVRVGDQPGAAGRSSRSSTA